MCTTCFVSYLSNSNLVKITGSRKILKYCRSMLNSNKIINFVQWIELKVILLIKQFFLAKAFLASFAIIALLKRKMKKLYIFIAVIFLFDIHIHVIDYTENRFSTPLTTNIRLYSFIGSDFSFKTSESLQLLIFHYEALTLVNISQILVQLCIRKFNRGFKPFS